MVPALRSVEAFPVEHEGRRAVALRDPAGYADAVVLLPLPVVAIVALFDGRRSTVEIQAEVLRRHGETVGLEDIEQIASALDAQGFLESDGFSGRRRAVDAAYLAAPRRAASHAGGAYPDDREALRAMLGRFFDGASDGLAPPTPGPVRGIIAPHIDFHRGGSTYAFGYRDLAERCDADLFVILGTCHAGMEHPFALTRKDYDTPLGAARVDRDFVEELARRAGQDCFASELAHRSEHSVEFQAVCLQYLFADRREVGIVPVLASFAHEALVQGRGPEEDPRVPCFLDALRETMDTSGRRVALIAGADLAHVGPRFGDAAPVSAAALADLARDDETMLGPVLGVDAGGFFDFVAGEADRRRICGLSPIYALLRTLGGGRGSLRRYAQWPDPQAVVTFASVTFS